MKQLHDIKNLSVTHNPGKGMGFEGHDEINCNSVISLRGKGSCLRSPQEIYYVLFIIWLFFLAAAVPSSVIAEESSYGFQIIQTGKGLSFHREMYMLPASYTDEYNGSQTEAVFQLSAKHQIFNTGIYFGYTQISFWQAYDYRNSSPFRETNYAPEFFYRVEPGTLLPGHFGFDAGFEHVSNGRKVPLSRSWNRLYLAPCYYQGNILLYSKFWYRIPEEEKESPESSVGDDNPDITDYMGHGEIHMYCKFSEKHQVHLMIRGNISKGKGGASLNYSYPVPYGEASFLFVRLWHGYGESLVDYNRSITRGGIGIMFSR